MEQLTTDEFKRHMLKQGIDTITNKVIQEDIDLGAHYGAQHKHKLDISHCSLPSLTLATVSFGELTISDCTIDSIVISNSAINSITIQRCTIKNFIITATAQHLGDVYINRNIVINNITIEEGALIAHILIESNNSVDKVDITITRPAILKISGNKKAPIPISAVKIKSDGQVVLEDAIIDKLELAEIKSTVFIKNIEAQIIVASKNTHLTLEDCRATYLELPESTPLTILGGNYDKISSLHTITNLTIDKSESSLCRIYSLELPNLNFGPVYISNCTIDHLNIKEAKRESNTPFKLRLVQINTSMNVQEANLECSAFDSVDLSNATIFFLDSSWNGAKIQNAQWPATFYEYNKESKNQPRAKRLNTLWALKAGYRKFKVLSSEQSNKIDAIAFQKHELKIYWSIVNIKFWHGRPRLQNLGNWLILGSNRLFSDFGQSLFRPLFWLAVVHSALYTSLLCNYNLGVCPGFAAKNYDPEATAAGLAMFFNLISPVHSFEIQNEIMTQAESIYGTTDFFMRISSGYFIYYFLLATRRFNFSI